MKKYLTLIVGIIILVALIGCKEIQQSVFDEIYQNAKVTGYGIKEITYEEFVKIRNSKEVYVLLDVLSTESFNNRHIPGAKSFPLGEINSFSAEKRISKNVRVIVYCASFSCQASTAAAKLLSSFGYKVLDYKGGLEEWGDKGNKFVSAE
ncbi:MAG: rhodanese-like domain-containing protein [Candidatus Omnitrophica bacterium]|nr:rhodanese-like domain-containing protein [Candidatus Omnitrophota bacterium]